MITRCFAAVALTLLSISSAFAQEAGDPVFHRELAERYAPVVVQGVGVDPKADVFTRVDYDGDRNSDNNWNSVKQVAKAGTFVYYDVIETKSHWFVTYGFFYPRDYSRVCVWVHCHENDFEGMRVSVEKVPGDRYGRILLLETLAHDKLSSDLNPSLIQGHPVVVIEKEGHGIHSWNKRRPDKKTVVYEYTGNPLAPRSYDLLPVTQLWTFKEEVGRGKLWTKHYAYDGERFSIDQAPEAYGGLKWGRGHAKPAWAWAPKVKDLKRGDWFLDPVQSLCTTVGCPEGSDGNYVYNPYVGITP